MVTVGELSERKASILRALVRYYIGTGEPVGSEVLANTAGLGVSSATIRNELAALEEFGYLAQPHTSAGRIPTDLAYREYVDRLPARPRLRDAERVAIVQFFDEALADVDDTLRGTTHLLSRLTRYASLALAPSQRDASIARSELVRIGSAVLLLVVFENRTIEKRVIDLPSGATDSEIEEASRALTQATQGLSLSEARVTARERARKTGKPSDRAMFKRIAEALGSIEEAGDAEHLVLSGVAYIAAEQAFQRRETLRRVYEALERQSALLRLLRDAAANQAVSVTIGRENPVQDMWEASVVAAPFGLAGRPAGTIGVVGPTRMDYAAAISAVRAVAERLSAAVQALSS
jgi:heat-inducible transcriptional repressor